MNIKSRLAASMLLTLILGGIYLAGLSQTKAEIVEWAEENYKTDGEAAPVPEAALWVRSMGFPFANWGIAKHGISSRSDDLDSPGEEKGWIQLQLLCWWIWLFILLSFSFPKKKSAANA